MLQAWFDNQPMHSPQSPIPDAPAAKQSRIVLCTLNAKYIHASLGLRYLLANMGDLRGVTALKEFTIARKPAEMADELLAHEPQVIGFGVYIWNVTQTLALVRLLKVLRPKVKIVLGGPEVSHEWGEQEIVALADYVITGWGEVSFPKLCRALLFGPAPLMKIIPGEQPPLDQIALPYGEYSDADLAHRVLYVEASRGCPFKCEFCLSSLDKTAWAFDLDAFLAELQALYARGARTFKFVDRTFNLKIDASLRILQFFLDKLTAKSEPIFVHFEVIPDHLPDKLKAAIAQFPPGVLQFEVGIQSFNVEVQQRISRRQDNAKTEANLRWLVQSSNAHLHTDLIFGLPGETLDSFAQGFDRLYRLRPHEIQLGLLKRLRGTPIARHTEAFAMVYDRQPPYAVQQTGAVNCTDVQRFVRLARYWDLVANSGRFKRTLVMLLNAPSPFKAFMHFSDWLWQDTGKTSGLTPEELVEALYFYLTTERLEHEFHARAALASDYSDSGARANPKTLSSLLRQARVKAQFKPAAPLANQPQSALPARQARHAVLTQVSFFE
jgi:radical SAM superfamily enzyme YgiQ (UPF0313 family)